MRADAAVSAASRYPYERRNKKKAAPMKFRERNLLGRRRRRVSFSLGQVLSAICAVDFAEKLEQVQNE